MWDTSICVVQSSLNLGVDKNQLVWDAYLKIKDFFPHQVQESEFLTSHLHDSHEPYFEKCFLITAKDTMVTWSEK